MAWQNKKTKTMNRNKDMQMYLQMFSPFKPGSIVKRQFSESDYALCVVAENTSRQWIAVGLLPDDAEVVAVEVTVKSMQ